MHRISLPRLVGSRMSATALADGLPDDLSDVAVEVDCRDLLTGSAAFSDQLVRELAVHRNAGRVIVASAPFEFLDRVVFAAHAVGVGSRIWSSCGDSSPPVRAGTAGVAP